MPQFSLRNQRLSPSLAPLGLTVGLVLALVGCGVAGTQTKPSPPLRHKFVGPHGRPLAYGGGMCAIDAAHVHTYPPTPRAAFSDRDAGAVDDRPRYPFHDAHPHHARTCFRDAWHLHLEPPRPDLQYDARLDAYRAGPPAGAKETLEVFVGAHPARRCDVVPCVESRPHGHAVCGQRKAAQAAAAREAVLADGGPVSK